MLSWGYWGCLGEYYMINCLFVDAFGVLSCPLWCTVLQCGVRLQIHTLIYGTVYVRGARFLTARFLTGVCLECDVVHHRSVAVSIRCSPMHPLYDDQHVPYLLVCFTLGALVAHRYTYSKYRSTIIHHLSVSVEWSCWPYIRWCGTRLWDWRVLRAMPSFIGLSCSLPVCRLRFSLSRLPFYWLVLWGKGLHVDRV